MSSTPTFQRWRKLTGFALLALTLSGCTLSSAIGLPADPASLQLKDVILAINKIITLLAGFGSVATIFVMLAGYQALLVAASDEAIQRSKDSIKYAAFGLIFIVFAYAIVHLIFTTLAAGTNPFSS